MVKAAAEGQTNLLIFVEPPPHSCALNQRGRTRMLGGVGRTVSNGRPYPISSIYDLSVLWSDRVVDTVILPYAICIQQDRPVIDRGTIKNI